MFFGLSVANRDPIIVEVGAKSGYFVEVLAHHFSELLDSSISYYLNLLTYYISSDVSRVFLGRPVTSSSPSSPFCRHGWRKLLNLVAPDALKMHSLAMPVLRFLCKTFSKLRKLNNETLFSVDV